jgi:hypothetical protein
MSKTQDGRPLSAPEKHEVSAKAAAGGVGAAVLYATVGASGNLAQGVGAVSAQNFSAGFYEVVFNANVSKGAYVATAACADPSNWCNPPAIIVSVSPRQNNANGVFIETYNTAGQLTNSGFNLIVAVD